MHIGHGKLGANANLADGLNGPTAAPPNPPGLRGVSQSCPTRVAEIRRNLVGNVTHSSGKCEQRFRPDDAGRSGESGVPIARNVSEAEYQGDSNARFSGTTAGPKTIAQ